MGAFAVLAEQAQDLHGTVTGGAEIVQATTADVSSTVTGRQLTELPFATRAALLAWLGWLIPRQVRAIGYAERADDLLIRKGILARSMVVVPYGRMQYVDVQAGPLARAFGIAAVQLHTASQVTGAVIHGLPPVEATRLRDQLASRGEARLAGL